MSESPWVKGGAMPEPSPGKPRFLRPEYDKDPVDYVSGPGDKRTPVFRHCARCGATWTRGRWENTPRDDGTTRPKYEGGGFFDLGARGSMTFACSCQAARQNYPNVTPVPDWYLTLWETQGRPLVAKSLERLEIDEALRNREELVKQAKKEMQDERAGARRAQEEDRLAPADDVGSEPEREGADGGDEEDDTGYPPLPF